MSSTGLEKFKLAERIRLSFIKHRGNVVAVAEELGISDLDYIKKECKKIQKRCRRDVSFFIATTLMEHLLLGYQQRVNALQKSLISVDNTYELVSACCKRHVDVTPNGDTVIYTCANCGNVCGVHNNFDDHAHNIRLETVCALREEDKMLTEFAVKMGYTNQEPVPSQRITQNVVVLPQRGLDDNTAKGVAEMSPVDREKLRKSLEKHIIEGDVIEQEDKK